MDFQQFRRYDYFLRQLKELSDFPDDGEFLVEIKNKKLPLKAEVKAPSRVVLESAVLRLSAGRFNDDVEIKQV